MRSNIRVFLVLVNFDRGKKVEAVEKTYIQKRKRSRESQRSMSVQYLMAVDTANLYRHKTQECLKLGEVCVIIGNFACFFGRL
jgi:hypothetical protein